MDTSIDAIQVHFNKESLALLNACLAYLMFSVAIDLKKEDFLLLIQQPKSALVGMLSQYIAFPAITFLLIKIFHPHPSIALGMLLVAACPSGNISNFITNTARGNTALSVSLTALSTVLCPVTTPLLFSVLGRWDSATSQLLQTIHVPFSEMLRTLLLLLLIPLTLGIAANYFFRDRIQKFKIFFKVTSLLIFFGFVVAAFMKNTDVFLKYIYLVAGLVFIQDLLGFISGYWLGRTFKLPEKDCRSISIETGIHNSGLGLLLVFSFFKGMGGMALIVAWWGIWHLIAGMSLATYWNRKQ